MVEEKQLIGQASVILLLYFIRHRLFFIYELILRLAAFLKTFFAPLCYDRVS